MNSDCIICLKNIKTTKSLIKLNKQFYTKCNCNFFYHNRCINTWRKRRNNCPVCREVLYANILIRYLTTNRLSILFFFHFITLLIIYIITIILNTITILLTISLYFISIFSLIKYSSYDLFMKIFHRKFHIL